MITFLLQFLCALLAIILEAGTVLLAFAIAWQTVHREPAPFWPFNAFNKKEC